MQAGDLGEVDPNDAWQALASDTRTLLIDVRTQAEWNYAGVPDLDTLDQPVAFIEWQSSPMDVNPNFVAEALAAIEQTKADEAYFICKSGVRSLYAAHATSAAAAASGMHLTCFNVSEGFEGGPGAAGHHGGPTGWKARGLPFRQP